MTLAPPVTAGSVGGDVEFDRGRPDPPVEEFVGFPAARFAVVGGDEHRELLGGYGAAEVIALGDVTPEFSKWLEGRGVFDALGHDV